MTVLKPINTCIMSKLSIYESAWLNLVFEGKNKEYGAYQLRKESPRTTLYAFLAGILFIASVSGLGMLLSSFGSRPPMDTPPFIEDSIHITPYETKPPVAPPLPPAHHQSDPVTEVTDARDMTDHPEIVSTDEADDVKENTDPPTAPEGPTGTGTDTGTTTTATGTVPEAPPAPANDGPIIIAALDKLPEFPGGIQKFYAYVGDNFEKPEIDETVNVLMSFVIEKDGTMTDIKVLRNPGYGLDKEAIRVLKSLRTKWKPGFKNGTAVRVLYTLPIKVTRN